MGKLRHRRVWPAAALLVLAACGADDPSADPIDTVAGPSTASTDAAAPTAAPTTTGAPTTTSAPTTSALPITAVPPLAPDSSLALCRDVPVSTTDVIGSMPGMTNPDPIFQGVLQTYAAEHADTFAGLWIDRDAGGTIVLAFTDDPDAHRAALAARSPQPTDEVGMTPAPPITDDRPIGEWDATFDVVPATYPESQLVDTYGPAIDAARAAGLEVDGGAVEIQLNRVSLHMPTIEDGDLERLVPVVEAFGPLDMFCVDGVLAEDQPPPIDPDAPLDVIVLPDADGNFPPDTEVSCHVGPFPLGALLDPSPLEEHPELAAAMDRELATGEGGHMLAPGGWVALTIDGDTATLMRIGGSFETAFFRQGASGWRASGSSSGGPCIVQLALPDSYVDVEWVLDNNHPAPSADSTEVHVLATEQACASAQEMGDRLLGPQVVETDDAVRISFAVIPQGGAQECPSNPWTPVTIELDQPLGDRELREGRTIAPIGEIVD